MIKNRYLLLALLFITIGCAKRGSITGGPEDRTPPTILRTTPENFSTHFNAQHITIEFDEFVKLKEISKNLIVSPPLKYNPEITPYGVAKKFRIRIKDTLTPNTTYSFNFGQSIEDNNEGNKLQGYKYVFSTGDHIDSLKLSGSIYDAYHFQSDNYVSVMLYDYDPLSRDSIVFKECPRYITNTLDSTTNFTIENIKAGDYLLVALKEKNNNYKFDQDVDKIGFHTEKITIPTDKSYSIGLFKENPNFKVASVSQATTNRLTIGYTGNIEDKKIALHNQGKNIEYWMSRIPEKDSINIWYYPLKADSLQVRIWDEATKKEFRNSHVKLREQKLRDSLTLSHNGSKTLDFRSPIKYYNSTPIEKIDFHKIKVYSKDSTLIPFTIHYDSLNLNLQVDFEKQESTSYTVIFKEGALTDYLGNLNTINKNEFQTKTYADFGNLSLSLQNVRQFPLLVELLDDKGKVMYQNILSESPDTDFLLIHPNKYYLRIIYDENNNGIWDTGNYILKRQPEKVIFFPEQIDVRANWDIEQNVILQD